MKYSIIIPTYNKLEEALKPCLESLVKYTSINNGDYEVLIIANGCTDETVPYIKKLQGTFPAIRVFENKESIGYTKAINAGIGFSTGEYIILLNNDTVFLDQGYNDWVSILEEPFKRDQKTGISGPMKVTSQSAGRDFLIFFCVMFKREILEKVGYLDEVFSPGYGEDTDFCCRVEDSGYKIVQVPGPSNEYYENKRMVGNFPIYHEGNVTFKNWPGGEELIKKNNQILYDRYIKSKYKGTNLESAINCDGFMSVSELHYLAQQSQKIENGLIIEIGSWHGKSSRAIADNMGHDTKLICVDHWQGSETEKENNHFSARFESGDHAFMEFSKNLWGYINAGRVIPIRMSSVSAAKFLLENLFSKADLIFLDGGHEYQEVKRDLEIWGKLLAPSGIMCGHDAINGMWPGVTQAVEEKYDWKNPAGTIWERIGNKVRDSQIFDCFIFNNELDLLDIRFAELYNTVDRFIIVEALRTHSGEPKELVFNANLDRYENYLNKVTYLVVESFPEGDSWTRERYQRDYIMNGLGGCQDDDTILISDADEIPRAEAIKRYRSRMGILKIEMPLYYYNFNTVARDRWYEAKILTYAELKNLSPCGARYHQTKNWLSDGGWHFSYMGGVEIIRQKIKSTAHQEYNQPGFLDLSKISLAVKSGKDIFGRNLRYDLVPLSKNLPRLVLTNKKYWENKGYILNGKSNNSRHPNKKQVRQS